MKLGLTQRLVLDNVAARLAPFAGHKSHGEYTRRMAVARELERRGLLSSLPFLHPDNTGVESMYRITAAGEAARGIGVERSLVSKPVRQIEREIREAVAMPEILPRDADLRGHLGEHEEGEDGRWEMTRAEELAHMAEAYRQDV